MPGWTTERRASPKQQQRFTVPMTVNRRATNANFVRQGEDDSGTRRLRVGDPSDGSTSTRHSQDSEIDNYHTHPGIQEERSEEGDAEDENNDFDDDESEAPGAYAVSREREDENPSSHEEWDPTDQTPGNTTSHAEPQYVIRADAHLLPESYSKSPQAKRSFKLGLILILVGGGTFLIGLFLFRVSAKAKAEDLGPCHFSQLDRDFAPYDKSETPNPFDQCRCEQTIRYVSDETLIRYNVIKQKLGIVDIMGVSEQINACRPQNLALVWLATYANTTTLSSDTTITQRFVLSFMYASLSKIPWSRKTGWLDPNIHECAWLGIHCDPSQRITRISLPALGMKGTIDQELAQALSMLTELKVLGLKDNSLSGPLPLFPQLSGLSVLDLCSNEFTGSLPSHIGTWTDLTFFDVGGNKLTGSLPQDIFLASRLKHLFLGENRNIVGTIPGNIGFLTMLTFLNLQNTHLEGQIPTWMGMLSNLEALILSNELLTGTLPSEFGQLTNLEILEMRYTDVGGTIPTELMQLKKLKLLMLYLSKINGTIPTEIGLLSDLRVLNLRSTKITGTIPSEIGQLTMLQQLRLSSNWGINGTLPEQVVQLPKLSVLGFAKTRLKGEVVGSPPICARSENVIFWPCTMRCDCCRSPCCDHVTCVSNEGHLEDSIFRIDYRKPRKGKQQARNQTKL